MYIHVLVCRPFKKVANSSKQFPARPFSQGNGTRVLIDSSHADAISVAQFTLAQVPAKISKKLAVGYRR
jgi:hypothetical protein